MQTQKPKPQIDTSRPLDQLIAELIAAIPDEAVRNAVQHAHELRRVNKLDHYNSVAQAAGEYGVPATEVGKYSGRIGHLVREYLKQREAQRSPYDSSRALGQGGQRAAKRALGGYPDPDGRGVRLGR